MNLPEASFAISMIIGTIFFFGFAIYTIKINVGNRR